MFEIVIDGKPVTVSRPVTSWRDAYIVLCIFASTKGFTTASVFHDGWERCYVKDGSRVKLVRN